MMSGMLSILQKTNYIIRRGEIYLAPTTRVILLMFSIIFGVNTTFAQSCNVAVQLAFSRAYGACADLERNQACYGGGVVTSDVNLTQDGDVVDVDGMTNIAVRSTNADDWSTAFLRLQANLSNSSQRDVHMILYGDAQMTNLIQPIPRLFATPLGTVNVRNAPAQNGDIIAKINVNGTVNVNGRNADNTWLRVDVPNADGLGWVSTEIVTLEGDINTLDIVTVDDVIEQPFERMILTSGADPICEDATHSGLLLQAPGEDEIVSLIINDAKVNLTGTAFIQAIPDEHLTIFVLEGDATIDFSGELIRMAGGTRLDITESTPTAVIAYDLADVQTTPYLYLSQRMQPAPPLSDEGLAQLSIAPTPMPDPTATPIRSNCEYIVIARANVRNGPTTDYDITQTLTPDTLVYPQSRTIDINGNEWLQVGQRAWLQSRNIKTNGECAPLPTIEGEQITTATRNTLVLENCEPTNGPIEVGQVVTIEFIPQAWENYFTALEATRYYRGRIYVGERRLYPAVTDPIKISENEWVRRFSSQWTAELGTYRIEGNFYAYEIFCTVTVVPNS